MQIEIHPDAAAMGRSAASQAAVILRTAIRERGWARMIVATGASQFEVLDALVAEPDIEWSRVEAFHLDEYVGLSVDHPASFRRYLRERFAGRVPLAAFHELDAESDPQATCDRVGRGLRRIDRPIDVALVGVGENGHLAFNDPPADFAAETPYHVVALDEACRRQQVGEGWFGSLDEVPTHAISMTVAEILRASVVVCSVPDERKAAAVAATLGPVCPNVPASALRLHPDCRLLLDEPAASRIDRSRLVERNGLTRRLSPMVDLQVNGFAGVDFNADDLTTDQFATASAALAKDECEFLPTLITDAPDRMRDRCRRLAAAIAAFEGRGPLGIHLEGPFLNASPGYIGAHPPEHACRADQDLMQSLLDAADGQVRMVTLSPECDPGGELTAWLTDRGITVFAGHSDATLDQLGTAIDAGLSGFTHLGNGCPQTLPRHDNIVSRVLSLRNDLAISLIGDRVHLPPHVLSTWLSDRRFAFLVSDATAAAGLGPGRYTLAGQDVVVADDGVPWAADRSHFVGSATPLAAMRETLFDLGLSEGRIVAATLTTPLEALGLSALRHFA